MVKQTFLNLEAQKRDKILAAALEEFSSQPYPAASLNRIVTQAGIPKGSLYQYFEDKKDLYLYLIEQAALSKLAYLSEHESADEEDFFAGFAALMLSGAQFDLAYPQYSRLLSSAMEGPLADEIVIRMKAMSYEYIQRLVEDAQRKGRLRADLPVDMLVFVLNTLAADFGKFAAQRAGLESAAQIFDLRNRDRIRALDLKGMIEDLMRLVREGMGAAGGDR